HGNVCHVLDANLGPQGEWHVRLLVLRLGLQRGVGTCRGFEHFHRRTDSSRVYATPLLRRGGRNLPGPRYDLATQLAVRVPVSIVRGPRSDWPCIANALRSIRRPSLVIAPTPM